MHHSLVLAAQTRSQPAVFLNSDLLLRQPRRLPSSLHTTGDLRSEAHHPERLLDVAAVQFGVEVWRTASSRSILPCTSQQAPASPASNSFTAAVFECWRCEPAGVASLCTFHLGHV